MRELLPASTLKRIFAAAVDIAIVSLTVLPVAMLLPGGHLLYFTLFLMTSCVYHVKCPMYQSLGQRLAKIRVEMSDDRILTARVVFNRTLSQFLCPAIELLLLQIVSVFDSTYVVFFALLLHIVVTLLWISWYLMGLFSPTMQTMHDLLLGTVVVVVSPHDSPR